ncbi:DUF4236 domain-containing protein [Chromobacterium piscinae]|uniref:DUF4236 domain-containing protein n=1 Tax=Chromobacterium piscinae TaxID=686831 RepID=UPI001E4E626E|nr:DUF4236 domain-containing protein [Chromobacterium piscinae]MCD5329358.1 DUF4236 domain-containing protein [Chromobacterium piscinae]
MGLSFSRSVKFGAVRFNFSGSGIGMSVGVPGLRIGTGPRGAYISGGVGGFRYRKSLNARQPAGAQPVVMPGRPQDVQVVADANIVATVEHETKSVLELRDSTSDALLQSMNEQRAKLPLWPMAAVAVLLLFYMLYPVSETWPSFIRPMAFVIGVGLIGWVYWRDQMRKLTVLFYEPDQATSDLFERLSGAVSHAAAARKLKSITTTSRYADTKYSAGASQGLKFGAASLTLGQAPGVVANIPVPVLTAERTTLAFFPDRVLAFQGKSVGAVDYARLQGVSEFVRYVESESVPGDARIIDQTWQYVNKKGGPDKRFKNNRQLPICAYSQFNLSTSDGLDIRFLGSKEGGFDALEQALAAVRAAQR